jgi:hypothetical protein
MCKNYNKIYYIYVIMVNHCKNDSLNEKVMIKISKIIDEKNNKQNRNLIS